MAVYLHSDCMHVCMGVGIRESGGWFFGAVIA